MHHCVLRTESEREALIGDIRKIELPMKVYYERIFPKVSPKTWRYLWGVCYPTVGRYIGEPDINVVHEICLQKFNVEYGPSPQNPDSFMVRIKRGSEMNGIEISNYIEKIAAFLATEFGEVLPEPQEL